jgi:hypothetical protein
MSSRSMIGIKNHLERVVQGNVEETLNILLESVHV